MPELVVTFSGGNWNSNVSARVGDMTYYCPTSSIGGFNTATQSSIVQIGKIKSVGGVGRKTYKIDNPNSISLTGGEFILFSKDNAVNMGSPTGYFARVKFVNDSKVKSEMFAASCEVFESSK